MRTELPAPSPESDRPGLEDLEGRLQGITSDTADATRDPGAPETLAPLSQDELRELMPGLLAKNGLFRTDQTELAGQAAAEAERHPTEHREYWSHEGRLLPIATESEMTEMKDEVKRLIESGETFNLPFEFKTQPGRTRQGRQELVCEVVVGDRLYKFVVPENQWERFEKHASPDQTGTKSCDVLMNVPYRISPRRTVVAAYPVSQQA